MLQRILILTILFCHSELLIQLHNMYRFDEEPRRSSSMMSRQSSTVSSSRGSINTPPSSTGSSSYLPRLPNLPEAGVSLTKGERRFDEAIRTMTDEHNTRFRSHLRVAAKECDPDTVIHRSKLSFEQVSLGNQRGCHITLSSTYCARDGTPRPFTSAYRYDGKVSTPCNDSRSVIPTTGSPGTYTAAAQRHY